VQTAVAPFIPIAASIAILRFRLYDIDVLINRTLVYAALTGCVVGLYVLIVGYLGSYFHATGNLVISLVATGLVAVLFQPLRERLQTGVNRLLYGERHDPYGVLSRLGERLEGALYTDQVLSTIVTAVAEELKLPHVAMWLVDGDTVRLGAVAGSPPEEVAVRDPEALAALQGAAEGLSPANLGPSSPFASVLARQRIGLILPLSSRGELVGALCLAGRQRDEPFAPVDLRLLRDLARQAGTAAQAVRLTLALQSSLDELRQSRERLVAAQEEERRRIQRDLHDGLGPTLASVRVRIEACIDLARSNDSAGLVDDLERLDNVVGQATADIRRLVHDLRPPALDQLGLVPALQRYVERMSRDSGIDVQLVTNVASEIAAAAEVAVFRVTQEALVNVQRHARASQVCVELMQEDNALVLKIEDDGIGLPTAVVALGTGLASMRERAELLRGTLGVGRGQNGGTAVVLRIPLSHSIDGASGPGDRGKLEGDERW
jgi:signal transduction histidine kinase